MNTDHLKNKYAIVGVGITPQGKIPERTAASFHVQACINAVRDAGIEVNDLDGLFLYRHFDPIGGDSDVNAFVVAEQLGIRPCILGQEYYCTRDVIANAISLMESGICKFVAISYGDNARSGRRSFVKEVSGGKATDELAAYGDLSTMAKYAMLARRAEFEFSTGPHVWKEISIAQREWALLNPIAGMYGKPLTDDMYMASEIVVDPFRMLDATPVSDGGRAIIITSAENARSLIHPSVYITGIGLANVPDAPYKHLVYDEESAASIASKVAYKMAGIAPKNVDACQFYDCFTYTVEATLVDYGFCKANETSEWITRKRIGPGGELPVNTSGGMLSEAYFMGLTPISEAVLQLMGRAGARQLGTKIGKKVPEIIVCSDNGGVFQSHCSLVLSRR